MKKKKNAILIENDNRKQKLFPLYSPITGKGSLEPRFKFYYTETKYHLLPEAMLSIPIIKKVSEAGSLVAYCKKNNKNSIWYNKFITELNKKREKYDFEFWGFKKIKIKSKELAKLVPFKLRAGQRKLLRQMEQQRLEQKPIRTILDKARQWGGSTLVQIYMLWIQTMHKKNWDSVIATQFKQQANNIRSMYELAINNYPNEEFNIENADGTQQVKIIEETGCKIYIGSLQNETALRSGNYAMAHYSEVGLWEETLKIKPENFISSISGSILSIPYTVIVLESTAKGEGNYFHREWLKAIREESDFKAVFVAWWEIEMYQKPFNSDKEAVEFYKNLSSYGKYLWSLGATLEGIHWYFTHKRKQSLRDSQMFEEFPSTWEESFISSGERVFPLEYVQEAQKNCCKPKFIGDIKGDAKRGIEALKNIKFEKNDKFGCLKIWEFPDENNTYDNRYVVCMDIGGRSKNSDYTVIRVIDRINRLNFGPDEFIATWRGHEDVDLAVWKATQLASIYHNAMLVIESNTINSRFQKTDGDHTYTVFDEIGDIYPNLYARTDPQKIRGDVPTKYGFFTGTSKERGKTALIDYYNVVLRDGLVIEHDDTAIQELNYFEYKSNGKMGAKDGQHDDVVMSSAIGLFVSKDMPSIEEESRKHFFLVPSYI